MTTSSHHRSSILKSPLRTCIATGEEKAKSEMVRFVLGPEGTIVPDVASKLPGRGVWVSAERAALETAVRKNQFARALKTKVNVPISLAETVETLLAARLQQLLALANKSGVVMVGFAKAMEALTSGKAALWFEAQNAGGADSEKLARLPHGLLPFRLLTRMEMGTPFGRDECVHVVVLASGIAEEILKEARRFAGFRQIDTL